jgi:type IV secretory pathway VirB9-like protein
MTYESGLCGYLKTNNRIDFKKASLCDLLRYESNESELIDLIKEKKKLILKRIFTKASYVLR